MAIDFTLTPGQRELQLQCRDFAARHLAGVREATHSLPSPEARFAATRPVFAEMVRAGFLRRILPAPAGGDGGAMVDFAIMAEEFMAADVNVPLTMFACMLGLSPVLFGGSPAQLAQWLPPFLAREGTPLAAFGFSEPAGSANFASSAPGTGVATRVRAEGGELVIDGAKVWVSNAAGWDGQGPEVTTLVCRADDSVQPGGGVVVVIVPGGRPGFGVDGCIDSLGHRAHLMPRTRYDGVRVPRENLIAHPDGVALIEASFTATAAVVGAFAVGVMRAAFDAVLDFAKSERRGGAVPIIEHQAVGYALADAKMRIEAIRAMTLRACHALDAGEPGAAELSLQTKVLGGETAVEVITRLFQVMGISSYSHEHPLAGLLQDAMAFPLFDGGNLGVRRRQLHAMMAAPDYDPLRASGLS